MTGYPHLPGTVKWLGDEELARSRWISWATRSSRMGSEDDPQTVSLHDVAVEPQ